MECKYIFYDVLFSGLNRHFLLFDIRDRLLKGNALKGKSQIEAEPLEGLFTPAIFEPEPTHHYFRYPKIR